MKINIALSKDAVFVLDSLGINPLEYGPAYGGESAGLDLYNVGPEISLPTHHVWTAMGEKPIMIPTGVFVSLPVGTVGLIKERGSVTKTGLISRAGVIDPGYSGEIFINLVNIGGQKVTIPTGAKLPAQLVVIPCFNDFKVITGNEFVELSRNNKREKGSLGSSDNQQGK